jgi:GntR family transcriptional regulator
VASEVARVPAYERIRDALRIEARQLGPGARFPNETLLAERFGVTRATIRNAVDGLISEGLVVREHGRGTFVLDHSTATRRLSRLTSFTEDLAEQGLSVETTVLAQEEVKASADVAKALNLAQTERVAHIARLRATQGKPVAIQHAWVPVAICPSLALEPLVNGSLYETIERRHRIRLRRAEQWISAVAANAVQAGQLGIRRGSPLLQTRRITYDETGRRVELALSWMRPEYQLSALLER